MVIIALCGSIPLHAQLSTASINGTVTDASGASIPDATLILANIETGVESNSITNAVGNFVFLNVTPGMYTLLASKDGFSKATVEPFTLEVNQTATFDLRLEVGSVTETISVEATGVEIQASTSEVGAVINERAVLDLPLNGRNFTQLTLLTPGASPVNTTQNSERRGHGGGGPGRRSNHERADGP